MTNKVLGKYSIREAEMENTETNEMMQYNVLRKEKIQYGKFYDKEGAFAGNRIDKSSEIWFDDEDKAKILELLK